MTSQIVQLDALDAALINLLAEEPRIGVLECSRRLRVARGTVQARLDKLVARGVIRGFGPEIQPASIGYGVTAFVTLEISQRQGHDPVAVHLSRIPEVLEAHTITGSGDLMCRVVARSNADLQRVIDRIVAHGAVSRASTIISLTEQIAFRVLPLVSAAAATSAGSDAAAIGSSGGGGSGVVGSSAGSDAGAAGSPTRSGGGAAGSSAGGDAAAAGGEDAD